MGGIYKDVSAKLFLRGVFSSLYEITGRLPQEPGRDGKDCRDDYEQYSAVSFGKIKKTAGSQSRSSKIEKFSQSEVVR